MIPGSLLVASRNALSLSIAVHRWLNYFFFFSLVQNPERKVTAAKENATAPTCRLQFFDPPPAWVPRVRLAQQALRGLLPFPDFTGRDRTGM